MMTKLMTRIAIRLGLVFAGFVVLLTVLAATGSRALQRETAVWRDEGLLASQAALREQTHEVGAAYERWTQAVQAMGHQQATLRRLLSADEPAAADASAPAAQGSPAGGAPSPAPMAGGVSPAEAAERLRTMRPLMTVVHAAAFEPGAITQAGPAEPVAWGEELRDRLHEARDFVRLLEAEARWHAAAGDRDAAARAIEAGLAVAERAGEHGVWLAQIARLSLLERMLLTIEDVYAEGGLPPASLRERLRAIDLRRELADSFRAEGVHTLRLVSDTDPETTQVNWSTRGWWYHDTAYLLEQYRACMAMLEDDEQPMKALPLADEAGHPFWARTARVVLPGVHASLGARLAVQMRLAMAETAMQLREQAAATGVYPATLEAVAVPRVEAGLDRPITYARDDGGFVLRSTDELAGEPVAWRWR